MCSYCKESKFLTKDIDDIDDVDFEGVFCELGKGDICKRAVKYIHYELRVEDHFCYEHATLQSSFLGVGLGELLQSSGLEDAQHFKIIDEEGPEQCSYIGPKDIGRCDRKPTYAKFILEEYATCKKHA